MVFCICVAFSGPATAAPKDEPTSTEAVRCLNLARIQDTDVLDDHRIVFKTSGHKMYLNELPRKCPGLRTNEPYLVRTTLDRLCDLDTITMLHRGGFGFMPGASCGLGKFQPVTEAQVEMVKAEIDRPGPQARNND